PSVEVRVAHRPATRGRDSVHRRQVRQFLERRPACAARHSLPCHTAGRRYAVAGPGSKEVPMTAPDTPPNDDYVLGRTSEAYQRLRWQARLWEPTTARVLEQIGISPGMRCLDVACGPGEVMRLMAERVGTSGQVTGVDNDGRLGREALEILRATVQGRFEFVEADVEATDELPGGPFDVGFARILLTP